MATDLPISEEIPSDKEGLARIAGAMVLLSSGSGEMAIAATTVMYVKLGEIERRIGKGELPEKEGS
jgi:hypothetical protein